MNEADKYAFEQIKQQYSMPFLQIGMNAIVNKKRRESYRSILWWSKRKVS